MGSPLGVRGGGQQGTHMVLPKVDTLIVEGNTAEADTIEKMLTVSTKMIFSVVHAATLSSAVTLISQHSFDAVLLDLALHDSDGVQTALALRACDPTFAMVVITELHDEEAALKLLQEGIQDYLVKEELTSSLLVRSIRYALQRKRDAAVREAATRECQKLLLQLQSVLENISDGVVICDAAGNIRHMNREALGFYQYDNPEEARIPLRDLQEIFELFDLDGTPVPYERWPMVRALRGERFSCMDLEVRRKDSGRIWFRSYSGAPVLDQEGEVVLGVMTLRDITQRTQTERAIRATQAQLQVITETMPVGVAQCSRERRYLWVSPEYARWHGLTPEAIAGREVREVLGEEGYRTISPYLEQVLSGQPVVYEAHLRYRAMGDRWVSGRLTPTHDASGAVDGWVAVVFDNTKHWEMEEDLRRSRQRLAARVVERNAQLTSTASLLQSETEQRVQALEELREKEQMLIQQSRLAAMGEMLGFIAHQWRQPLNLLGLLMQELTIAYQGGQLTAEHLEGTTRRGMELIGHMARTIEDFRGFFKAEKERVRFSINDVLQQALKMVQDPFRQLGIVIDVVVESDDQIEGFPNELSQVILNILLNARDAFAACKTEKPMVSARIFKEGNATVLTISDNAGGIPAEVIGSIFEPYFTTKRPEEGTGLGLYMAKVIVEKNLGGKVSACNTAEGAQFRIQL